MYILIGKTGSRIDDVQTELVSAGYIATVMSPADAITYKAEHTDDNVKIIYIKIPFCYHWDCTMLPDYWEDNKNKIFVDETVNFRNIDSDVTFTYDGTNLPALITNIKKWVEQDE